MTGFRWCARSATLLVAVFALCFGWHHAPVVSAKDNDQAENSKEAKSAKDKSKAATNKKARSETAKKSKKKGDQETAVDENQGASGTSGSSVGSGSAVGTGGTASGSSNSATQNNQTAGKASADTKSAVGGNNGVAGKGPAGPAGGKAPLDANHPVVKKVIAAQNKISPDLIKQKGIVGTSTGLDDDGNVVVRVHTTGADNPKIPKQVDGINVVEVLTGPIHPLWQGSTFNQQARQPRPVPIGVSAFDDTDPSFFFCAAGTLGCRLRDAAGNVYGLSNNHVFAGENLSEGGIKIGTPIVQPASLDNNCIFGITNDRIGNLFKFKQIEVINFNLLTLTFPTNLIDAAIITTDKNLVSKSTPPPPVAYGTPRSITWKLPVLGMGVMKFGRTSGFTHGTIIGINQIVFVPYTPGLAFFINQIEIFATDAPSFGIPGDSGSLVVTNDPLGDRFPIALLFAGGGGITACNPIQDVLDFFKLEIDGDDSPVPAVGKSGRTGPNEP